MRRHLPALVPSMLHRRAHARKRWTGMYVRSAPVLQSWQLAVCAMPHRGSSGTPCRPGRRRRSSPGYGTLPRRLERSAGSRQGLQMRATDGWRDTSRMRLLWWVREPHRRGEIDMWRMNCGRLHGGPSSRSLVLVCSFNRRIVIGGVGVLLLSIDQAMEHCPRVPSPARMIC